MIFDTILPLIKKTGSSLSPPDFHHIVNVTFHDIEAQHYDAIHASMWESLQEQIALLADDALAAIGSGKQALKLLDIGCGTGLSTQMLLKTKLGERITDVTLLDTSSKMLAQAKMKSANWNKNVTLHNSDVASLDEKFDVIIVSSVLHHIPDLEQFLNTIDRIQSSGGIFIHLQDPNGDYKDDPEYLARISTYEKENAKPDSKGIADLVPKSVRKNINRLLGRKTYIDHVNDNLIACNAIINRMTADEIWSVTDIHVENLPFSTGKGISVKFLTDKLRNYSLVNMRSYGFFGGLKSELSAKYQTMEQKLIEQNDHKGRNVSGVWLKTSE